ncbi:hypothetical protein [Polyangium mundeleinium]|uniref:Uncharacterized protein n=1 Tax=Polyangium mundeleinium TaxID=2995306 RepID=A0ABT5EPR9_9BACT|nr:hypothetical protein [Polyangium mundeleinium]MDC0743821.1 hypothetical protein [Polyangium mundeleinium]
MLPLKKHPTRAHAGPGETVANTPNGVAGKSVYVADVDDYELYRTMLYGLGAKGVTNKLMATADVILHGAQAAPQKARAKYPSAEIVKASAILPLFHQEIRSFSDLVRALQRHGFTVRNPSDEGDAEFDHFELPLVGDSLHETLLHWLGSSAFIRSYAKKQHFPIDKREEGYIDFPIPDSGGLTWYYTWNSDAWSRVHALRGEGDYPLDIKGHQLLRVEPLLWTQSTGLYFHEYPLLDSITGLFIQAGVDARTGRVNGTAISRVWT